MVYTKVEKKRLLPSPFKIKTSEKVTPIQRTADLIRQFHSSLVFRLQLLKRDGMPVSYLIPANWYCSFSSLVLEFLLAATGYEANLPF